MKRELRILLFVLCISFGGLKRSFATELPVTQTTTPLPAAGEVLEPEYVSLELKDSGISISILKTVASLVRVAQSKYYSLLSWNTYSRHGSLEIANYDRIAQFGRWINDPNDETCYNTRALVLMRDSAKPVVYRDTNHCSVQTGHWNDPYTGQLFTATEDIQIDHLVPLKNAFMSGAYKWSFRARCLYANYLGEQFHLISVNGSQNMKKGDKGPDKYIPPNADYTCTYLKNWLTVKFLWGLKMTVAESEGVTQAIKDSGCDARLFRLTQREVLDQARFAHDNINLCEKIDNAREALQNAPDSSTPNGN